MSRRTKRSPKLLQWRLECLAHSIIEGLAGMLPGPWVFRFGEFLGTMAWHLMPMRRKIVLRNLRIACAGEESLAEIHRMAKATFRRSGANLVSAAHTARLTPQKLARVIHIENLELLENALATGKGVVLLLAHMGNWEILSRIVHLFPPGSKTGAFYRPLNNRLLDERILRRRQADGTRMFSKRDPFHQVTGFLRDGGIVGILADQRVGMQGEVVPFFGRLTRTSPLPSLLARRAKAEVLALALVTEGPGKWKAVFTPVEKPHSTVHCMAALEKAMRTSLTDVFWLQERWKVYVEKRRPFHQWLSPDVTPGDKPHRALLWLVDAPEGWKPGDEWFHPDLSYEAVITAGVQPPDWLPESLEVHMLPSPHSPGSLTKVLRLLDQSHDLPCDFILSPKAGGNLAEAAACNLIRLIRLQ